MSEQNIGTFTEQDRQKGLTKVKIVLVYAWLVGIFTNTLLVAGAIEQHRIFPHALIVLGILAIDIYFSVWGFRLIRDLRKIVIE